MLVLVVLQILADQCIQVLWRALDILYKVICYIDIIRIVLVLQSLVAHIKTTLLSHKTCLFMLNPLMKWSSNEGSNANQLRQAIPQR